MLWGNPLRNAHKMTTATAWWRMKRSRVEDTALHFQRSPLVATLAGLAVYLALDYVSYLEAYRGLAITPWSPGSGFALALVIVAGVRSAGVALLAPPLAGMLVRSDIVPIFVHFVEGITLGGNYLAIGLLARHFGQIDPRLLSVRDVLVLMAAALAAATMAALCYVGVLGLMGILMQSETLEAFGQFLVGDLIGMLIVSPLVLLAASRRLRPLSLPETGALIATIALALAAIFLVPHANELQLFYLLFLPLVWSALRGGIAGVAITLSVLQIALILTVRAPFTSVSSIVPFQVLMIWLASSGLIFGILVAQQRAVATRLQYQQLALERALRLRAMGEVATGIAHEINQPLTTIKTLAGVLRNELMKPSSGQCLDVVEKIRAECDRASSIVRATREALRQQSSQPTSIAAAELLAELESLVTDRLAALDVRLATIVDPRATRIYGERTQISQALYNLLDNSLQAIEAGGKPGAITIEVAQQKGGEVFFEVRDTGPGFPADVSGIEFPPLVSTRIDGTGIGLSIVRSVAESHGGRLTINERDGETCVGFTISSES
ncbi:MAG: ATP-binding protein [Hyphomicrobiaceae bacterium]